jgi:cobalt-zinc-cadmium efflux system protein
MEHPHSHSHSHSHTVVVNKSNKNVFLIGIGLNMAFVLAEAIAGIAYNSMALLTDAGHNLSDVASLVISLVAFWMAKKQSSAVYTYGYKKTTVLAALVNAVVLLIAIGVLGYEAFTRLFRPEPVSGGVIAWVAALGIIINSVSAFLFFRQKHELNSKAAYLHLLADALVSLGVVIAGIAISYTHLYWLDPAIGLVIMIVILVSTWGLLRDSFKMTIDAVPAGMELDAIKKIITGVPHVKQVHHVHVWSLSTTENALTAHVVIDEELPFDEKLQVIDRIKHELGHHNIHHSTIEIAKSAH